MNLRISERQLRFRISRDEMARLMRDESLNLTITLPWGRWSYHVQTIEAASSLMIEHTPGQTRLLVDRYALMAFEDRLPARDGLIEQIVAEDGAPLTLVLEVDVKKPHKH